MSTDSALLRQYVEDGAEATFAEIVRRYVVLVYSVALRLVGDQSHLADDIAQDVFILLARKAPMLVEYETLVGWLYTTTRYVALRALRAARSRQIRERESIIMQTDSTPDTQWRQLRPLLDVAVAQLNESDRQAVLLRYFQGCSHHEVGAALGQTEDAARMRVDRAVEKLRRYFARSGVVTSVALLGEALATNTAHAIPAGFVGKVTAASVARTKELGLGHAFLKAFYMTTKTKIAIVSAALVAVIAAIPLQLQNHTNTRLHDELAVSQQQVTALKAWQHNAEGQLVSQAQELRDNGLSPGAAAFRSAGIGRAGSAGSAASSATMSSNLITLDKSLISNLHYASFGLDFKVTPEAVALLQLTPDESAHLQSAIGTLMKNVQDHDAATMRQITPDQATDPNVQRFLQGKNGEISVYTIPADSEQNRAAALNSLKQSVNDALGPDRGKAFMDNAEQSENTLFTDKTVAFVDSTNADGSQRTSWIVQFYGPGGSGSYSSTDGDATVPPQLAYLFQEAKENPSAPTK